MGSNGLRDIDIGLLRAFVAVAETRRMTAAARVVNLSQGAVSQQIKRLEELFGTVLFERKTDAMTLTRDGERLIVRARRLIALNDDVVAQMRGDDFSGEVRFGVAYDIVAALLPPILRTFRELRPNVLVTLVSDTSRVLHRQLRERDVDLALLTEAGQGSATQFLRSDRLVWVGARDGEAHLRRPLSVALGEEDCAFRAAAVDSLNQADIDWRAICQVGSLEPVYATLEADMAVAPFLACAAPARLVVLPDGVLPPLPQFHINLHLPSTGATAVAEELARHVREGLGAR